MVNSITISCQFPCSPKSTISALRLLHSWGHKQVLMLHQRTSMLFSQHWKQHTQTIANLQEKLTQLSLVSGDSNLYRRSAASMLWLAMVLHCQLHVWNTSIPTLSFLLNLIKGWSSRTYLYSDFFWLLFYKDSSIFFNNSFTGSSTYAPERVHSHRNNIFRNLQVENNDNLITVAKLKHYLFECFTQSGINSTQTHYLLLVTYLWSDAGCDLMLGSSTHEGNWWQYPWSSIRDGHFKQIFTKVQVFINAMSQMTAHSRKSIKGRKRKSKSLWSKPIKMMDT